ncbi:MAG: protein translocase subunit SecF [Alphaproteobacteria bacterium]|nr:protein translocase subunit SecF [Alphaproteobacteria bacterium]MBO6863264.1 protein translocase subunit SecF [Alphaproteobacteria bacterium]MEC9267788.1 protein translocase subunit SecF [Pseudomonadota bacterium]
MLLRLLPEDVNVNFMARRKIAFAFSLLLVVGSIALFGSRGLNLGIDFLGGTMIEVKTEQGQGVEEFRAVMSDLGLGDVQIQEFGAADDLLIRIQRQPGDDVAQQAALATAKQAIDDMVVEYRRVEVVGPTVGSELQEAAIYAICFALGAILIYIWFRFEWQFSVCAIIALVHDVITTIGLFALLQLEFNLATVAAVLTIAGYSINDTVVVFDRVRENIRKYKTMPFEGLTNLAINQTLSRTLMTSVTTLIALLALSIFGGEVIRDFSIALIWGVVIGTYSSILVAVPLLLSLEPHRGEEAGAGDAQQTV